MPDLSHLDAEGRAQMVDVSEKATTAREATARGRVVMLPETLALIDAVGYAQAFSFKYSPRPGTPAATMDDQVPASVMDERLQRLQEALNRDQLAFNQAAVGKRCEVLVERKGKLPGQMLGKSPWLQSTIVATDAAIGDLLEVEITAGGPNSVSAVARVRSAA